MNKDRFARLISILFLVVVIVACSTQFHQEPSPATITVSAMMPTNTLTSSPTSSPRLTITSEEAMLDHIELTENSKSVPDFLTFFSEDLPTSTGTYLLYKDGTGLKYTSLDRSLQGTILEFTPPYSYQKNKNGTWDEIHYTITQDGETPKIILYVFESGKLYVWILDLSGKLLSKWTANIDPNSETVCSAPQVSPKGNWMAGSCNSDDISFPYFLDLEHGTGNYLANSISCNDSSNDGWQGFGWSNNEQFVRAFCGATLYDEEVFTCYYSFENHQATCSNIDRNQGLISMSPNGIKGVQVDKIPTAEMDTPTNAVRIAVASPYCLLGLEDCKEKSTYELPLYKWFDSHSVATQMKFKWSPSGTQLAWEITPRDGNDYGQTTTGVIDLKNQNNNIPFATIRGTLLGFSPDEEWLLYVKDDSLVLLSVDNLLKQHLLVSPPVDGRIDFPDSTGWLVVP